MNSNRYRTCERTFIGIHRIPRYEKEDCGKELLCMEYPETHIYTVETVTTGKLTTVEATLRADITDNNKVKGLNRQVKGHKS